jgi:hemerythrin-like metal-binding protein
MDKKCLSLSKVNIAEIDKAHLEHVQLLKELSDAIETNTVTKEHIEKIKNSLKDHFEEEEKLMENHNVPTLIPHKKEHRNIIYKFDDTLDLIGNGGNAEKSLYVEYLHDIFLSHVDLWDSQYVPYVNKVNESL